MPALPVAGAGHWVHHDQLEVFLREVRAFLRDKPDQST
jgi:pimeloyl-ACP methyl ester carboxylesterase